MADLETQAEWAKSRAIEAERLKAAEAVKKEEEKFGRVNLAYADPKVTKVKGYSRDLDVVLASSERMGNRSIILVVGGVVLAVIGDVGGVVSSTFNLGLAGLILDIPGAVGWLLMGIGGLMAMATIVCEVYFRFKNGRKMSVAVWSAIPAVGVILVYVLVRGLVMRL